MPTKLKTKLSLYNRDFHMWAFMAAANLRADELTPEDREQIAQEIEDMARRDERELKSRARNVIHHILKWTLQPKQRSKSWLATIERDRAEIEDILEQSPSLKASLYQHIDQIYDRARRRAIAETGLDAQEFPDHIPFSVGDLLDPAFSIFSNVGGNTVVLAARRSKALASELRV